MALESNGSNEQKEMIMIVRKAGPSKKGNFVGCVANFETQLTNMRDLTFVPVE